MNKVESAIAYHEATKHHFNRYARSLGYLDWATQPDPFRRYAGAPLYLFPFSETDDSPDYGLLYQPEGVPPRPLDTHSLSAFFQHALGLSAWKSIETAQWELRCNPSSGNLHPTEGYLIAGPVPDLSERGGVYHYAPREHGLEQRTTFDTGAWQELTATCPADFFVGVSSVHWREAWKYGERAYRYCQHDAGHALAALRLSAAALGWRAVLVDSLADTAISSLLGLAQRDEGDSAELEHPDFVLALFIDPARDASTRTIASSAITETAGGTWMGTPNVLSPSHAVDWEIIDETAEACEKPETEPMHMPQVQYTRVQESGDLGVSAWRIFQQRRSAVAMDGRTSISRETFYRMLARVTPAITPVPWDALPGPVAVHLGLFVHRVNGLTPGMYCLIRDTGQREAVVSAMKDGFIWKRPAGCPEELGLYLLDEGDVRATAVQVSCVQDIAGAGAFSLGMLAHYKPLLDDHGAWFYRRLHWEAGMIGQVLYLEAEAAGIRATGIGCFFDDPVHELCGLRDRTYQTIYHFTVGGPVEDARLTTLPPYTAERRRLEGFTAGH